MKYLYLLSQDINRGYDTYDSCIVCAESEEKVRLIHPNRNKGDNWHESLHSYTYNDWVLPSEVKVTLIGIANETIELNSVVFASFHAG